MDYEKKYKEALERARQFSEKPYLEDSKGIVDYIFPELKESEDEKWIPKEIAKYLKEKVGFRSCWIAWLEKQGKKKSIWHNEDEEPQRGSLILLIMQSGNPIVAKIIEPNHTFNHGERWAYIDDLLDKQGEQKPAWNEEDEDMVKSILALCEDRVSSHQYCYDIRENAKNISNWLKSLKDRVQPQPKQGEQNLVLRDTFGYEDGRLFGMNEGIGLVLDNPEKYGLQKPVKWSKEDEGVISLILSICNDFLESFKISPASTKVVKKDIDKINNWLKSLRPQKQWKPSDEQMDAIDYVKNFDYGGYKDMLVSLYYDLKKLKG